ncbi:GntR family transcriptional regulator [Paenibacillus psychroresistens]|uniref:GntR family transcriptional regulator n=1 Tax=Paenibacillus psychroresistens TaxID=1778678 RepID=A0A6B8RDR8_9BACL|nr:GntR family transcriptional regulator [Paenibacillus psychroresistens]QGQ94300.1 GntR family transcriptional regulator [Paenibacillus psychroresistens]
MNKYDDPLARALQTKEIVKRLRTDIILGKYRPGSRLIEATIATQMGISRAPIRTSLQMLAQEGLVLNLSNGGTEVVGFSIKHFIDLFDLRLMLEKKALEMIISSSTFNYRPIFDIMETFDAYRKQTTDKEITSAETSFLDMQFHRSIINMLENNPLLVAWNSMANVLQAILEITNMTSANFEEFYNDHKRLADLVIQKNPKCVDELVAHISKCKDIIVYRMEKIYTSNEISE